MQVKIEWDTSQINDMMRKLKDVGRSGTTALVAGGIIIEAHAKMNAENQGLHKTGNLIGSIQIYDKTDWSILVGSRGVIYAAIHEFGGIIKPKIAKMLSWINEEGERIFAKRVVMPMRAYLRPAIDEHKHEIIKAIGNKIAEQLK